MATVPLPRVEIVELRQVRSRQLAPLFEEQQRAWQEELRWDYKPSLGLIKKHIDARALPGYVALLGGEVAGYCFFVYEEVTCAQGAPGGQKGLIGDLFVRQAYRPSQSFGTRLAPPPIPQSGNGSGLATQLLEHALETLEGSRGVVRMEAQVMPFGIEPLAPVFLAHNFRSYPRLFMYRGLKKPAAEATGLNGGVDRAPERTAADRAWEIERWDDGYFEPLAELIVAAYAGHIDSHINDQYGTRDGALKFLKNIVVFPGCGMFRPEASLVVPLGGRPPSGPGDQDPVAGATGLDIKMAPPADTSSRFTVHGSRFTPLAGALLVSQVAPHIAHITQVCVRPEVRGRGLGRQLLARTLDTLRQKGYEGVSLSVTADNPPAVGLYRHFGFEVLKRFAAYVREKPPVVRWGPPGVS
ncbi:MAG: GNAT family N-acetyltransferase [Terriglobia bacterium]